MLDERALGEMFKELFARDEVVFFAVSLSGPGRSGRIYVWETDGRAGRRSAGVGGRGGIKLLAVQWTYETR